MRFLFGDYAIDADRRELRRAGEAVHVEPQVFDLLLYLIRNTARFCAAFGLPDSVAAAVGEAWRAAEPPA